MAARKILTPFDFVKNEIQNAVIQVLASAPGSPVRGQVYSDSTTNLFMYHNGTGFVSDTARSRHSGTQTAATISDFDTQVRTSRLDQMAAPTASVSMNSQKITGLLAGTSASDAINLQQLQDSIAGLSWKDEVRAATAVAGTLASSFANGSAIDGVTLATNDRILIKDQVAGAENGIYVVQASGAPVRATDADSAAEIAGSAVFVSNGTANAGVRYVLSTSGAITLGTTALSFAVFGGGSAYVAGAGLTLSTNTFNVGAGTGITVNADDVQLDTSHARNVDHSAVTLTAGAGLTGGGDISASRSFAVGAGTGITVNADDVALDTGNARNVDHTAVTLTAGAGLTGGGDISASRSFAIGAGTGITVNADDVAIDTTVVARKYTALLAGAASSYTVNHALGNQWVTVQIIEVATLAQVECDIVLTDANNATVIFAAAQSSNAFRAIVVG
jgi:hypothetical protein